MLNDYMDSNFHIGGHHNITDQYRMTLSYPLCYCMENNNCFDLVTLYAHMHINADQATA